MIFRAGVLCGLFIACITLLVMDHIETRQHAKRVACVEGLSDAGWAELDAAWGCAVWLGDPLASYYGTEPVEPLRLLRMSRPDWHR